MKKYIVSRQVIFEQIVEVEADSDKEALLKAKDVPYSSEEALDFLETDYYEIVEELQAD